MIEIRELTKRFGEKTVVDGVTVTIEPRTITSFIGPNGAGKSTLLSMVSRLLEADSGEVLLDQTSVKKWKPNAFAKRVSILKQTNHLNVRLTVRELVSFGRYPYSKGRLTPEDERIVDRAIAYMNLQDMEDRFLDELSGGQRQRAFIAMVIAQDTDYILLDEPLNNLDMRHSVQMMRLLRSMADETGKTVVLVVHDINFAAAHSDRIVAMRHGRVVADGDVATMMSPAVLGEVFDMDIDVHDLGGQRVATYFR